MEVTKPWDDMRRTRTETSGGENTVESAMQWFASCTAAIDDVFLPSHAIKRHWDAITARYAANPSYLYADSFTDEARGVLRAGLALVVDGHAESFRDTVRCETENEFLEQASVLCGKAGWEAAGAVLAGGALETHLQALCVRAGLAWKDDGSIAKYDGAIAQARNGAGPVVYNAGDTAAVKSWAAIRNEAAHRPTEFVRTAAEVRTMIDGIRQFIERTR